ncbi:MAG: VOC family protein [Planctomycetota bacterium]|jgi:catechol 2,3-dioxygenase-like lactoylglutathione lyase family enzyme
MTRARYVHTNLVARDWRRLAGFYRRVFGCEPAGPERDLCGPWLDRGTGVERAHIRGMHLRLPGHGADGPTLEIFQYDREEEAPGAAANRPGYGHIAFAVDDVELARKAVLAAGGSNVGQVVSADIPDSGALQFIYVADPEGNLIELQRWES